MVNSLHVVYILLHFPYLTETFVAEEIRSLREQGVDVQIVSLLEAGNGPVQHVSQNLLPHCWYAPGLASFALWQSQIYYLITRGKKYLSLLFTLLRVAAPEDSFLLRIKRLAIFLKAVAVAYHLRHEQIDLLHAHFAWLPGAGAWICAQLLDRPFTVTAHAYDIYASADLLPLLAAEADHLVTISEYNRQHIITTCDCPSAQISVVHCGVNLAQMPAVKHPADAHAATDVTAAGPAHRPLRILSVGSLNQKKGHRYLIEACQRLKAQGVVFTCSIVGRGAEESNLRALIEKLQLQTEVELVGALTNYEIIERYQQYDLFVLASVVAPNGDRDGIPVVMLEAGAQGLPLVSTNISGIPEVVRPHQTGLLVPPADADALAEAILQLAHSPSLRQLLGKNAQSLVQTEFDIDGCTRRLVEIFQGVVHSVRASSKLPTISL